MDAVIYHPVDLATFIEHIIANHAPQTTMILCMSRENFASELLASIKDNFRTKEAALEQATFQNIDHGRDQQADGRWLNHPLLSRSLRLLFLSNTIQLAFCNSIFTLQAHLSSLPKQRNSEVSEHNQNHNAATSMLVMVNPIALHRETASYSAQGLSKTFATTVEAAIRGNQKLAVVECSVSQAMKSGRQEEIGEEETSGSVSDMTLANSKQSSEHQSLWEADVPILNATTKTFGAAGEKAWSTRTVKISSIVNRWFTFALLPSD